MDEQLIGQDFELILTSLQYTRQNFENYKDYPSYEFKKNRLEHVDNVMEKIRALRDKVALHNSVEEQLS